MQYVGIDIASERHVVAVVSDQGEVLIKPTPFSEDAGGYQQLRSMLGVADQTFIAMEATGHYWQNLFAYLTAEGFRIALLNPVRTHRFAGEELQRTKTDAIDALGIARFAAQKRPAPTQLPDAVSQELRELVRLRDRVNQDFGDRLRQLHRLVDLGFPEFTRHVSTLASQLAITLLHACPTAAAFATMRPRGSRIYGTMAATRSARCWPKLSWRPHASPWGAITVQYMACRFATPAKIWKSCVAVFSN
jgi:transposase